MTKPTGRPRGRPRKDGRPSGSIPAALPVRSSARDTAEFALEALRAKTRLFREKGDNTPRAGMGRMYRETRKIARICSADMMYGLIELAATAEDERVRMMSMMAVLDRGGIMPTPYNPDEDTQDTNSLPLAEKKERLKLLLARARELVQEAPPGLAIAPEEQEG